MSGMSIDQVSFEPKSSFALGSLASEFGGDFDSYVRAVEAKIDVGGSHVPVRVASALARLLSNAGWLPERFTMPGEDSYRRHLLYADPRGRFTILSLVWRPGQGTPVHGHTAWGAVGVYSGTAAVANYCCSPEGVPEFVSQSDCQPGAVCHVEEGADSPHRVFNPGNVVAVTIHTYGRDLTVDPGGINILFD